MRRTRARVRAGYANDIVLRQRFYKAADRLGYRYNRFELDMSRFVPPARGAKASDDPRGSLV